MSSVPVAARIALLLLAGSALWQVAHAGAAWDPAVVGRDAAGLARRRFAAAREELTAAGVTRVAVLQDAHELDATQLAVLDLVAASLHRRLSGAAAAPPPGFDHAQIDALAEGFRANFPAAQNADAATVRANLRIWWQRLATGWRGAGVAYALAPLEVSDGSAWCVVDLLPGSDVAAFAARRGVELVRDCGDGVAICRVAR